MSICIGPCECGVAQLAIFLLLISKWYVSLAWLIFVLVFSVSTNAKSPSCVSETVCLFTELKAV